MSDISVLENQYKKLVSTSDTINNSVIVLKKQDVLKRKNAQKLYPKLSVTEDELEKAQQALLPFIDNVISLVVEGVHESEYIPAVILEDYKQKLRKKQYLKEDLADLKVKISQLAELKQSNLELLDSILSVLDFERSTLFRKLRTARG